MPARVIPLFPLQLVVFPRTSVPLHIFEERYKEMVGEAIRNNSEFGIVLAKESGIVNAGCTAAVSKIFQIYPDGRMDILVRGQRRFEIVSLNEEKAYLQAEVQYFEDEDTAPAPEELRREALTKYEALRAVASLEGRAEPDLTDPQLSFQLAQGLPDRDFLGVLLRGRSETDRLKKLNHYLAEYIPRQRAIEHIKAVAPNNGFGGRPAGL